MAKKYKYRIADLDFSISFTDNSQNDSTLLPSFAPFETPGHDTCILNDLSVSHPNESSAPLFHLYVDDMLSLSKDAEIIRDFDTGNGYIVAYRLSDGGYQFIIRNFSGQSCCLLQTNAMFSLCRCALKGNYEMRSFGLNNALMLVYAFAGSYRQTLLIHASCIKHNGKAFPFIAKSGTGKSTHSSLWLKHIAGSELINDDNPIIRFIEGKTILYGSPWSGKTPCYKNINAPIGAIVRIARAQANSIERLSAVNAFASLLPSCSSMKWDETIYNNICNTITAVISTVPSFTLHCLPDKEAAMLCHKTMAQL